MKGWLKNNKIYIVFLFFIFIKGLLWVWSIPPFLTPDELPHFAYAQYLAEEKKIPKNSPGKISPLEPTLSEEAIKSSGLLQNDKTVLSLGHMDFSKNIRQIPEEFQSYSRTAPKENYKNSAAVYSPFYYAIEAIPYALGYKLDIFSRLYLMRMFSLIFLFITIIFAYEIALFISKEKVFALVVAAIISLAPSVNASSFGGVNNDAALIAFSHIIFYYLLKALGGFRATIWSIIGLGALLGLTLITKPTALIFIPLTSGVFICKGFKENKTKKAILAFLGIFAIALILSAIFYIDTIAAFNNGSSNGNIQLENILSFQNVLRAIFFDIIRHFFLTTSVWLQLQFFDSFYPPYIKSIILGIELFAVLGLIQLIKYDFIKNEPTILSNKTPRNFIVLCVSAFFLISVFYSIFYYRNALIHNYYDFGWFGRYYLPMIGPIAVLLLLGLKQFFHILKIPEKFVYLGLLIFFSFLHNYAFFNMALQYNYL